jgi:hypothetical protein
MKASDAATVVQKLEALAQSTQFEPERENALAEAARLRAKYPEAFAPEAESQAEASAPKTGVVLVSIPGDEREARRWVRDLLFKIARKHGAPTVWRSVSEFGYNDDERGRRAAQDHIALRVSLANESTYFRRGFLRGLEESLTKNFQYIDHVRGENAGVAFARKLR